jgi:predicted nucleotidyltransferase
MTRKDQDEIRSDTDAATVRAALIELQAALKEYYGHQAPVLLLYGSYSRKEPTSSSDVDIVLLYPGEVKPGKEISQLRGILSRLNLRYQILISVLPVSLQQYQTSPSVFWKNVRREAVPIDHI